MNVLIKRLRTTAKGYLKGTTYGLGRIPHHYCAGSVRWSSQPVEQRTRALSLYIVVVRRNISDKI